MTKNDKTCWIFGDSFVETNVDLFKSKHTDWYRPWTLLIEDELPDVDRMCVRGLPGTGVDWAYDEFRKYQEQMKPGDYLIFVVTHPNRFWLFEDRPELSNVYMLYEGLGLSQGQMNALEGFKKYIDREERGVRFLDIVQSAMNFHATAMQLQYVLIPAFPQSGHALFNPWFRVTGSLVESSVFDHCKHNNPSKKELLKAMEVNGNYITNSDGGRDHRVQHLSWKNHEVLAKKIAHSFMTREPLELDKGFYPNVIENQNDWDTYNYQYREVLNQFGNLAPNKRDRLCNA